MTDIPIIFECQAVDSWRHKFDLWRHRGDTVSFMSTIHPKYSTEMHKNTTFYAELNGEHAGEGFMPLRSIFLEIWAREAKTSRNFRKFDLWPAITGSNINLGPKIIPPIASTRRAQSAGLFCEALRRFVWKRQGGVAPPYTGEGGKTRFTGEGDMRRIKLTFIFYWQLHDTSHWEVKFLKAKNYPIFSQIWHCGAYVARGKNAEASPKSSANKIYHFTELFHSWSLVNTRKSNFVWM